jgi:hypothetical protein
MTIDEMQLEPAAREAATILKNKHPKLEFTSGRRTVRQQAHAMARNIVERPDRKWIEKTYLAAARLQQWVDLNPQAVTVDAITDGLEQTMNAMAQDELLKISKHLTGRAFDIKPVILNSKIIKADILQLPGLHKFLDHEGGKVRWHAQFD